MSTIKISLVTSLLKKIRHIFLGSKKSVSRILLPIFSKNFTGYNSTEFKEQLKLLGILPGDSLFIMHSQDKIYLKSGKVIPSDQILRDLLDYLGNDATIMVLGFSLNPAKILSKEKVFDVRKTPTGSGIIAEILRRKKGAIRSLHPFLSAISYGKNANYFCEDHHKSIYPFDEYSPYYKMMQAGGKYLGIGVGFEAFTPCHMIDDYYKKEFKHNIYHNSPEKFTVVNQLGEEHEYNFLIRNPKTCPYIYDPHNYFKILNCSHQDLITQSGIKLFTFRMKDFFDAAIQVYNFDGRTVWDTGNPLFTLRRESHKLILSLLS